jgi:hypothetical protein
VHVHAVPDARGAAEVAGQARMYRAAGLRARFAVVNGGPGVISVMTVG